MLRIVRDKVPDSDPSVGRDRHPRAPEIVHVLHRCKHRDQLRLVRLPGLYRTVRARERCVNLVDPTEKN